MFSRGLYFKRFGEENVSKNYIAQKLYIKTEETSWLNKENKRIRKMH